MKIEEKIKILEERINLMTQTETLQTISLASLTASVIILVTKLFWLSN